LELGRSFNWIKFRKNIISAGSSAPIRILIEKIYRHGLSGLECMAGIPGTLGGAVVANAGLPEKAIGNFVYSVKLMTPSGRIVTKKRDDLRFSYRFSNLKNEKSIILEAALNNLQKKSKAKIKDQITLFMKKRRKNQPYDFPSAGCIFKNPPISPAGILIDFAGLKGLKIGGAQISKKHANFILNVNSAKAGDVLRLIERVRKEVYKLFRINLELEIEKVGGIISEIE